MYFYAVRFGKIPGVYTCWNECRKQVIGYKGAIYKKFNNKESAEEFYNNKSKTYNIKQPLRTLKRTKTIKKNIHKDPNALYIFTDGSSINNGSKNSTSGFGIYIPEPETMCLKISSKLPNGKTNNYAELKAILKALKILDRKDIQILKKIKKDKVIIVTDSQYSINCITLWYHSWVKKGWINATGEEVKNKVLIQEIQPLTVKHKVIFKHIKAHTSKKGFFYDGNRIVDKLANGMDV
jgi:ribonuclease HI